MTNNPHEDSHSEIISLVKTIGSIASLPHEITMGIAAQIDPEQDMAEMTIGELLSIRSDTLSELGEHYARQAAEWLEKLPAIVECRDMDCETRGECPHSSWHPENEECHYVCGADEPCSRCYPVEAA
ncbi:MAG: hypothetical protein KKF12_12150 [Proteobacteria bacterium]|nr:hypothetical protein [Desulfobacula sp.]MBU3953973.1 hypothetical protein [Pseudomonadota bacterium]MBU4131564.1 hypothetical protein [Pseudomonadota bacterium]